MHGTTKSCSQEAAVTRNCAPFVSGPVLGILLLSLIAQIALQLNTSLLSSKHYYETAHEISKPWEISWENSKVDGATLTENDSSKETSSSVHIDVLSTVSSGPLRPTRVIFGIMSHDMTLDERNKRQLIRATFLSYFVDHINRTMISEEEYNEKKHWVCALNDLDGSLLEYPDKCRLAYAFVLGANSHPNASTMLLTFNESYPLALPPPPNASEADIKDVVYLNIKENGKYGKSPTWFGYASDFLKTHQQTRDWDYIFKSDTDNLLNTASFFRFLDSDRLPKQPVRVYGGRSLDYKGCGGDKHDHCSQLVGPLFNGGGCYFLSVDLAEFISNETSFDHQAVKLPHEDMTTSNFVFSHQDKINTIREPMRRDTYRVHPVKTDEKYLLHWNRILQEEQERLKKAADRSP